MYVKAYGKGILTLYFWVTCDSISLCLKVTKTNEIVFNKIADKMEEDFEIFWKTSNRVH